MFVGAGNDQNAWEQGGKWGGVESDYGGHEVGGLGGGGGEAGRGAMGKGRLGGGNGEEEEGNH